MKYQVIVLRRAELELNRNAIWWAENRDAEQAVRWLDDFLAAIQSLRDTADRHGLAAESHLFPFSLRQLVFGVGRKPTHRALFAIHESKVVVYAVRHLSQAELTEGEIP